jgi:protocatechuate 3,4-dioxygenase beta subunit
MNGFKRWIFLTALTVFVSFSGDASLVTAAPTQVTPALPTCSANGPVTPSQTEGPFYRANTPQRTSLIEPGMTGAKLIVTGYVLAMNCRPVPRARLDFWQADDRGNYDNSGFRLRGHQFTDSNGRYQLETIAPGLYPGRTRHIHVKVQAPNGRILTTQLYIPGEPRNQNDGIFNRSLVMDVRETAGLTVGTFHFILDI